MWINEKGDYCDFKDAKWWAEHESRIVGRPTMSRASSGRADPGKHPWGNFKRFEYTWQYGDKTGTSALYCANRRIAEQFIEVWNDSPGTWQYELLPGPEEEPEEVVSCCPTCKRPW